MIAITGVVAHWIVFCFQNPDSGDRWTCFISVVGVVGIWRLIIYPTYYSGAKLGLVGWYKHFWKNDIVGQVAFWWLVEGVEHLEVVSRFRWLVSWQQLGYRGHALAMPLGGWFARARALNNFQHDIAFSLKSWTDDVVVCTVNNRRLDPRLRRAPRDRFTISIYSLLTAFNEVSGDGWLSIPLDGAIQCYQLWLKKAKKQITQRDQQVADDINCQIKLMLQTDRWRTQKEGKRVLVNQIGMFLRLSKQDDPHRPQYELELEQLSNELDTAS